MLPNCYLVIATKGPLERQAAFTTRDKAREWRAEMKELGYASGVIPMVLDDPSYGYKKVNKEHGIL